MRQRWSSLAFCSLPATASPCAKPGAKLRHELSEDYPATQDDEPVLLLQPAWRNRRNPAV